MAFCHVPVGVQDLVKRTVWAAGQVVRLPVWRQRTMLAQDRGAKIELCRAGCRER